MHNLVLGVLTSFSVFVVLLGGLEAFAWQWERRLGQGPLAWPLVASRRMTRVYRDSADGRYFTLQPAAHYTWQGTDVELNARGFRDPEWPPPGPSMARRVLNLGDSIAFGWNVSASDRYGNRLQTLLRNGPGDVEVLNAGVPGWGPLEEYNFLRAEGLEYRPEAVILDITLANDVHQSDAVRERRIADWLRDNTYAWPFLAIESRLLLSRFRGPEAIPVLNPPRFAEAYFPTSESAPAWDEFWGRIAAIRAACKTIGARLVLLIFPTAFQINSAGHPDTPQRVLRQHAERDQIETVDLLPVYAQACRSAGVAACEGTVNLLFADVWMHPNSLGHELAARALYERLR